MIFSKPVTYAIRSLLFLSIQERKEYLLGTTIASSIGIPSPYLVKILGTLTSAGILQAVRGPGGGFQMSMRPEDVSFKSIVELFDGVHLTTQCLLGLGKCDESNSCPVHDRWKESRDHIDAFLKSTTIETLRTLLRDNPDKCFNGVIDRSVISA